MTKKLPLLFSAAIVLPMAALAQNPISSDSPYQVRYAANLGPGSRGDSIVNLVNTGASGGNICVGVYTYSPDEQLISCCACLVTPNALLSLSVKSDLISNTLTPAVPSAAVVKLLATTGGACDPSGGTNRQLAAGLAAWGTTIHAGPLAGGATLTETAFKPSTLSNTELFRMVSLCGFIQSNGSGYGICRSCRPGALGAGRL